MFLERKSNINDPANINIALDPINTVMRKDYARLGIDFNKGIKEISKVDLMTDVQVNLRKDAKRILKEEVDGKISQVKIHPIWCILLAVAFCLFLLGGGLALVIFPYNFIIFGIGLVSVMGICVFMCVKAGNQQQFFKNASDQMSIQTGGEMILEPIIEIETYYRKGRRRQRSRYVGFLLKHKNSKMTMAHLNPISQNPLMLQNMEIIKLQQQQINMLTHQNNINTNINNNPRQGQNPQHYPMNAPNNPYAQNPTLGNHTGKLYSPFGGQNAPQPQDQVLHVVHGNGTNIENYDDNKK